MGKPGAALQTALPLIESLTHWSFVKISLRSRHALKVEDGAFSHKIDLVTILLGNSKSQSALMGDFAEWFDFAYRWSFSGGSTGQPHPVIRCACISLMIVTDSLTDLQIDGLILPQFSSFRLKSCLN